MNKQTIINKIIFKSNIDRKTSEKIIDKIFEVIKEEIITGKKVEIEGFGKFEKIHREMGRKVNKKKGIEELLPPRDKVKFEPSVDLLTEINKQS